MLFEKPSLRTRVSFEAGISQLGGTAMFLGQEVGWQSRESTADFVRVLAEYADFVVCRAKSHSAVEDLAKYNAVPIINGLTDKSHPCQALADLLTMRQHVGSLAGRQVTFVGDGNNVARSLALGCAMVGMKFRLLGPRDYFMPAEALASITDRYPNADIEQSENPKVALPGSDFVYTDVWTSMGQEAERAERQAAFKPFQLNGNLIQHASPRCKVLHCLPARRGEEITDDVMDSASSAIIEQAGNRMHAQKALLLWLSLQHGLLSASHLESEGIDLPVGTS
jgi:ornithine carbamoyltransferase